MATAPTAAQTDALGAIKTMLDKYGLPASLATWAWGEITKGKSFDEIGLDLQQTPEFNTRFPAIELQRKAGVNPVSPGDYVTYENHTRAMLHFYGIPQGIYDTPAAFTKLLVGQVSPSELDTRLGEANAAISNYSPDAMNELKTLYGVSQGGILAYALDPALAEPVLARQFAAAKIAGISDTTGYGALGQANAEMLAKQGLTDTQAQQGLGQLAGEKELFTGLPGQGEADISQQTQLGAEFGGNATDQETILARQRQRTATFGGSSNVATTSTGAVGLSTNQA